MKNQTKKNYVTPAMLEFYIELENGIAAGSAQAQPPNSPTLTEEEGVGGSVWDVDTF